jgi:hypothetical protein
VHVSVHRCTLVHVGSPWYTGTRASSRYGKGGTSRLFPVVRCVFRLFPLTRLDSSVIVPVVPKEPRTEGTVMSPEMCLLSGRMCLMRLRLSR